MAIRDGEASSSTWPLKRARRRPHLAQPGLFIRSLLPSAAVTASVECFFLPSNPNNTAAQPSQLVVASNSCLILHTVDASTATLRELDTLVLHSTIRDVKTIPSPVDKCDIVVALFGDNTVAFVGFDTRENRMRIISHVQILHPSSAPVKHSRIVATHPRHRICAVASLTSSIAIFPVLFIRKHVMAGKIVNVGVEGVILGMDFLEDDSHSRSSSSISTEAILLVLVQRGTEQWISVYTVSIQSATSSTTSGLAVSNIGSMITCSERPDESAVARHAAKLGIQLRAPSEAVGLARIPNAPYLFAVFLEDRIVAADARPIISEALESRDGIPLAVRIKPELDSQQHIPFRWGGAPSSSDAAVPSSSGMQPEFPRDPKSFSIERRPAVYGEQADSQNNSNSSSRGGHNLVPLGMIAGSSRASSSLVPRSGIASALVGDGKADPFLSYLYVPSCVSLDLGDGEGAPTSWTSARNHFCNNGEMVEENGMYVVMESGALFALRWSYSARKGAYFIPTDKVNIARTGPRLGFSVEYAGHVGNSISMSALDNNLLYIANDGSDGSLRYVKAPPHPAGSPGTDKKWAVEARTNTQVLLSRPNLYDIGYTLDVRQEYINLAPISDFVVVPSASQQTTPTPCSKQQTHPHTDHRGTHRRPRLRHTKECKTPPCSNSNNSPGSSYSRRGRWSAKQQQARAKLDSDSPFSEGRTSTSLPVSPDSGVRVEPQSIGNIGRPSNLESEILVCCGMRNTGTVRIIKPGAAVSVYSSSSSTFQGCNDLWSIRISAKANIDTLIALSYNHNTRVLFSVPPTALPIEKGRENYSSNTISHLLDASDAVNLLSDVRSLAVGRLNDGLIAQVYPDGIRTVSFLNKSELQLPLSVQEGRLTRTLVKHSWDWNLPRNHKISTAAIGAGFIFLGIIRGGDNGKSSPSLVVLNQVSIDSQKGGLNVVAQVDLEAELSFICIPKWLSDTSRSLQEERGMMQALGKNISTRRGNCPCIFLGTYAPAVEVWSLEPYLRRICIEKMKPWFSTPPEVLISDRKKRDEKESAAQDVAKYNFTGTSSPFAPHSQAVVPDEKIGKPYGWTPLEESGESGDHARSAEDERPTYMKSWSGWSAEKVVGLSVATCVPESICAYESNDKRWVLVGLRNGVVLRYLFQDAAISANVQLKLLRRRRLGDVPVKLYPVVIESGAAVIAKSARDWIVSTENEIPSEQEWVPLGFPETRAWCSYSTPGAGRCLASITQDNNALHICAVRSLSPFSVHSVLIGATPKRILALQSPVDSFMVATAVEPSPASSNVNGNSDRKDQWKNGWSYGFGRADPYAKCVYSELKVYHKYSKRIMGQTRLNPGEIVHVLLKFADFVVVGTSVGLRSVRTDGFFGSCDAGRILLYSVSPSNEATAPSEEEEITTSTQATRSAPPAAAELELCSEICMPGAVMAGAVHPDYEMLVLSCNSTIIVFGMMKDALFEVARATTRLEVLTISINGPIICVADKKDSVAFFRLDHESRKLIRDRTDPRNRLVTDAEMVDSKTAIATDKLGGLFSVAYTRKAALPDEYRPEDEAVISESEHAWNQLLVNAALDEGLIEGNNHHNRSSPFGDSIGIDDDSESLKMRDVDEDEEYRSEDMGTDSGANGSDTVGETTNSNDGNTNTNTTADGMLSFATGVSTMNDDYSEVEEVEGASIVETAGTTEGHDIVDIGEGDEEAMQVAEDGEEMVGIEVAPQIDLVGGGVDMGIGGQGGGGYADGASSSDGGDAVGRVPRQLVCEHNFNLRDAGTRIRKAVFRRIGMDCGGDLGDGCRSNSTDGRYRYNFWGDKSSCILLGTMGGAVVSGVPISADTLNLLNDIALQLVSVGTASSSALLERNVEKYRVAEGEKESRGVVDGDLVGTFLQLDMEEKKGVCEAAGYTGGEDVVYQIESLIHNICDRVG